MINKDVYWLEEIGQEYNDLVGKKCANLGEMLKVEGIRVPPGFAISVKAYEGFDKETGLNQEIVRYIKNTFPEGLKLTEFSKIQEASAGIRKMVESRDVPSYLKQEITAYYRSLCEKAGRKDVPVSVRSAGTKSHPGQYETYLNVSGSVEVLEKVVKVWSSMYNARSLSATIRQSMSVENSPPLGVCVLKMVNVRSAGVCVTVNPITGDDTEAVVEGSWGLGEGVVSGAITPDKFIVDKVKMVVKEKIAGKKEKRVVAKEQGTTEENVPADKQGELCLTDEEVISIVDLSQKLEAHFGVPQDVEWATDNDLPAGGDCIVLLQARPQTAIPEKKSDTDKLLEFMKKRRT